MTIDLRSDTITRPSPDMLEAMKNAPVGDDVWGEDPTANTFQEEIADLFGKDAAVFVPSGTMGNQLSLKSHCEPGDEVICDYKAHIFNYESAAAGNFSQVQLHPLHGDHGRLSVDLIKGAIRDRAYWNPWTKVIALENTHNKAGGTIYPIETIESISTFAREQGLAMHLDGARLWNAHVATGIPLKTYASYFDSLSVCFSKGLGAPVGSVVLGSQSFIKRVHRYRKMFGGGMRQIGGLVEACRFALKHNLPRLKEDHSRMQEVATLMNALNGIHIEMDTVQSNILIADVTGTGLTAVEFVEKLKGMGVLMVPFSSVHIRAVTHLDITEGQMDHFRSVILQLKAEFDS